MAGSTQTSIIGGFSLQKDWGWAAALLIILVIAVALIVVWRRRRKSKGTVRGAAETLGGTMNDILESSYDDDDVGDNDDFDVLSGLGAGD